MVIGFIYLKKNLRLEYIIEKWRRFRFNRRLKIVRDKQKRVRDSKERIDIILDKINKVGYENLTEEEKKILYKASSYLSKEEGEKNQT